MVAYGELIREVRLSKGLTQKEVYTGIISKSYAIGFEKGKHDITLGLFEEILKRVMLSSDEFFFMNRGFSLAEEDNFWYKFAQAANQKDLTELETLHDAILQQKGERATLREAIVHSRVEINKQLLLNNKFDVSIVSDEDKAVIQTYLWKVQSWTLEEIRIFANSVDYFEEDVQIYFFQLVLKSIEKYKHYDRGKKVFSTLLTNITEELIARNQLDYATQLLEILYELSASHDCAFYRIMHNYYQGLIWMKSEQVEQGLHQSQRAVQILNELNYEPLAILYQTLLTQFLEKEQIPIS
ncbi:Rgg family transcriptional regulator [Listeria swaminathanii]|uniref:Rgg family transcriptional regulator n=1 Tax=Listeria swaminathanii TaxID=2713501 RepID=A0ABU2ID22_9LIST|nr:Rgg family transcriptional regulator [Listeria swaminathanii]MDT0016119.1 Rgg family transcriptional regulator [Listeria swaminathanii]MDT0021555.1 Rgg family transcriptional regulator [Listeria swaminathanii]MDT0032519.1 Rgg family transcriptional regulator [Listeria swaminathanii]MDT0051631.1 Rgg family transcriptional regulator [Listeria swaminathanii]MDT0054396.1 Rgg family transcriptional regulator [Listeria swaminathanii]